MAGFPQDRLPVTLEMAFGADDSSPLVWTWVDVGSADRLHRQTISPNRGRSDESADTQPSTVSVVLDNPDGDLTPDNPSSQYWPNVKRHTPLRLSVDAGGPALRLGGTGFASTPDHADFDVTDLDVRIRVHPDGWATAINWSGASRSLADPLRLISRWDATGDNRAWNLTTWAAGWPAAEWSTDGTQLNSILHWSDELVAATKPIWVGMTIDADDGAGGYVTTMYRHDAAVPPTDITTWDVVDTFTGATTTTIAGGTSELLIGALASSTARYRGRILAAEHRDAINGTIIADPDFTAQAEGATSFTDSTGKLWTLNGDAAISTRRTLFVGRADDLSPWWPHGDNEPDNPARPSESRVSVTASGLLRRLTQGESPLRSTLTRHVTSPRVSAEITAYWPAEDERGAVRFASGIPDDPDMVVTGLLDSGSDDTLDASGPLPTVRSGETITVAAPVTGGSDTGWAVDFVGRLPSRVASPAATRLITINAAGDAAEWRVSLNSTTLTVEVLNAEGATVDTNVTGVPAWPTSWFLFRIEAAQNGSDIDWEWSVTPLEASEGGTTSLADTITTVTLGRVIKVGNTVTGPADGYSFGHFIVTDGTLQTGWLAGADTAWVGESAAHRFWRLCSEEGIACEILGDPSVFSKFRGDLSLSQAMGPQQRQGLTALLRQCAQTDLGIIIERRSNPGLIYRCRATLEAQDPALILDAASNGKGDIIPPLEPVLDDQGLRNDITVTSTGGSSARTVDQASIDGEGHYEATYPITGVGGVPIQDAILAAEPGLSEAVADQNIQTASWRLHLGTWAKMRYPTVTMDLGIAPAQIAAILDLEIGDRVQLINLPAQHPFDIVELLVENIVDPISPTIWQPQLTCSPGGPWLVGVLT